MPELPEVETIVRQIRSGFEGLRILQVEATPARIFQNISPAEFCDALRNKRLQQVWRYGKFLCWKTENFFPVFHLGMSGIFMNNPALSLYPRHIHLRFAFENGKNLYFQDVRKFGKVFLYTDKPDFNRIGIDPLSEEFTLLKFRKLLSLSNKNIKSFLMDQHFVAGVGNIYANEALFLAGISPLHKANKIGRQKTEKLFRAIKKVLSEAIDRFGTTYSAYRTVEGTTGGNQNFLQVYQKNGEVCPVCGTVIRKTIINSRSTFYCPKCQR